MTNFISFKAVVFSIALIATSSNSQTQSNSWETMKYGLFIHYVFGGEYGGMTPLSNTGGYPKDIDEFVDKFNVGKFANDVKDMG